jgi:membrane fusion protein, multidrug efflux system
VYDDMSSTSAPATEQTKAKYSAVDAESRVGVRSHRQLWTWVVAALVLLVTGYVWHRHQLAVQAAAASKVAKPAVPVAAVRAKRGDLNLYLSALGSVTPFNTATIKSRVDGQIVNILFKEGQNVKEGDLLIVIDPRPYEVQLTQAQGQMAKDLANYQNAKVTVARYQTLYSEGVLARQDLDNQQSLMNQARGAVESDRGAIDSAKLNITYSRITAPITGRIGLRIVDIGNIVHAADTTGLAVVTQLQPISVIFAIPEDDIPQVSKKTEGGQAMPVEAWDRAFTKQISSGTLLTFDNQIDQTTGTVRLKAQFDNSDYSLFPSQFVNARLLVDTVHDAVLVPSAAVQKSPQGSFVYVVKPDNSVAVRDVTIGATQGDTVSIASGVADGDMVVTDGVDKLQPGAKVNVRVAANSSSDHKATE